MSEEIRDEMSFAEMFAESEANLKPVFAGKVVEGTVTSITPNEVQVDIGTKHTGFVKVSELTDDPTAKAEDLVKVGDKLDLVVEKVNDQEGVAYLISARRACFYFSTRSRMSFLRAWKLSSKSNSLVSTSTASSACFKGAVSRWVSCQSRWRMSSSTVSYSAG